MRPEVKRFAELMEAKLKENDFKGGWQNDTSGELYSKLARQFEKIGICTSTSNVKIVREICVNIANYAMMMTDNVETKTNLICEIQGVEHSWFCKSCNSLNSSLTIYCIACGKCKHRVV